ncbi:MAG: DnaJ domain-containing protein [Candidatus Gastranaerophilales bacterium]|nr:DnaJ domain-containing protein [Candidatus Gastranaerophilales bacterium]
MQSYYEILNVKSTSSKEEIKKQYKKLVRMYHPDVNSSPEAEEIFKNITRASEVLLDDEKRKKYDLLRSANKKVNQKKYDNSSDYTFSDLFQKNKKTKEEPKAIQGEDITVSVTIDSKEAILGTTRTVNIATSILCPKCEGHKFANNQKCTYCEGRGEITKNKKITVKIPSSVKNKSKLRIKGEGKTGKFGGKNGNLYVVVNVEQKHEDFKIENGIVYYDAYISPYTAILGGNVKVPTLWGDATIKIPPLTKTNQSFKLIDVGIMNEKTQKKGDEIVKILIQIPTSITDEEFYLYEKLKEINLKKRNAPIFQ